MKGERPAQRRIYALVGIAQRPAEVLALARPIEQGTPLAEVLRAQAADVREAGRRRLLEAGGRKEIAMMVPVARRSPSSATQHSCPRVRPRGSRRPCQPAGEGTRSVQRPRPVRSRADARTPL